jgi:hypothetical protein
MGWDQCSPGRVNRVAPSINTEHISCNDQLLPVKRFKGSMPQRCSSVLTSTRAIVTP